MSRMPLFVAVVSLLAACDAPQADSSEFQAASVQVGDSAAYEVVASELDVPWGIAFAPPADGRMFVTERVGRVRVIRNGRLEPRPWATLDVAANGEAGLMGIALAPDFSSSRHVFVCATVRDGGRLINRVVRLTDSSGLGTHPKVIVDGILAAEFHAGDAVAFGPDHRLYVATGDARSPSLASNPRSLAGKILRYAPDGSIPSDNPTPGSPVYASGLRNVQGLAWDPETKQLFATDHGPSGFPNERFRRNNDELNAIRPAASYGWPSTVGASRRPSSIDPILTWSPAIAPSGIAVYTGPVAAWSGNLFVGALRGEHLRRIAVVSDSTVEPGWRAVYEAQLFPELGRIRAVAMGPDGYLYFSSSNRDGRGETRAGDDHIYRLRVKQSRP